MDEKQWQKIKTRWALGKTHIPPYHYRPENFLILRP
jgi:hypothetical protein